MKEQIISGINDPVTLEKLYRENKTEFRNDFMDIYPQIESSELAKFWNIRLQDDKPDVSPEESSVSSSAGRFSLIFTVAAAFICGTIFKIPQIFGLNSEYFVIDNAAFVLFPALTVFYLIKNNAEQKKYILLFSVILAFTIFMNVLPWNGRSDTRILSALHFSFVTWLILGASFVNFDVTSPKARMLFLKRNGDTIILTGVLLCAGMVLTMLTVSMFSVIKVRIDKLLENYVVVYGLVSAPLAANYMIERSPKIINKVAPFISRIFTPLMLVVMTGFLAALVFYAKDPFNNREELIIFNILLAAIIAVIIFTFSGNSENHRSVYNKILLLLSVEALVINSIALSAIIYRLFSFGVSPNKIAVLGANLLLFLNLIIITIKLVQFVMSKTSAESVEKSMTDLLPYYGVWAAIVAILMPLFFAFK
ncbi:MAG: hypothetical protein JNK43_09480 [Ignavibacteria bacterium]|nr:hypothetical protein [Ignavibacteria bacterium]